MCRTGEVHITSVGCQVPLHKPVLRLMAVTRIHPNHTHPELALHHMIQQLEYRLFEKVSVYTVHAQAHELGLCL